MSELDELDYWLPTPGNSRYGYHECPKKPPRPNGPPPQRQTPTIDWPWIIIHLPPLPCPDGLRVRPYIGLDPDDMRPAAGALDFPCDTPTGQCAPDCRTCGETVRLRAHFAGQVRSVDLPQRWPEEPSCQWRDPFGAERVECVAEGPPHHWLAKAWFEHPETGEPILVGYTRIASACPYGLYTCNTPPWVGEFTAAVVFPRA